MFGKFHLGLNRGLHFKLFSRLRFIFKMGTVTYEERAAIVADNRCVKLVKDMHYEAQVQCIINFCALFLKQKIGKPEARELKLTREQYLQVPAWWCRNDTVCWERIVDK